MGSTSFRGPQRLEELGHIFIYVLLSSSTPTLLNTQHSP